MQLSKMLIASAVVLAASLSLAQANYQGANYPDSQRPNSCHNCPSNGYSNSNGVQQGAGNYQQQQDSYDGQSQRQNHNSYAPAIGAGGANKHEKAYGPYHSYAVRPAVYGGHRMYHYRGYARQHGAACNGGHNCGSPNYALRPVNALVLAPAYGSGYGNYLPARHHQVRALAQRPRYGRGHGRRGARRGRGQAAGAGRREPRYQRGPRNHSNGRQAGHSANRYRQQSKKNSSGGY